MRQSRWRSHDPGPNEIAALRAMTKPRPAYSSSRPGTGNRRLRCRTSSPMADIAA